MEVEIPSTFWFSDAGEGGDLMIQNLVSLGRICVGDEREFYRQQIPSIGS